MALEKEVIVRVKHIKNKHSQAGCLFFCSSAIMKINTMNKKPLKKTLEKVVTLIGKRSTDYTKGNLNTGFYKLDECLSSGNLTIIAGIPGIGKTALALDVTRNLALKGKSVGYVSMGESEENILSRLLASLANVPMWKIRVGKLNNDELLSIKNASDKISDASIFINDVSSPSLNKVIDIAKEMDSDHKLDLLIIDYLQLIDERNDTNQDLGERVVEKIRSLARRLNIPVLLLVQAKEILKKGDNYLRTLRRVGNLEKVADVIIFINRFEEEDNINTELLIEHNRLGNTGKMNLFFDPLLSTFHLPVNQVDNIVELKSSANFLLKLEESCRNFLNKILR